MKRFQSILAYVQGLPERDVGLAHAAELARASDVELTLMSVVGAERRGHRNVIAGALATLVERRAELTRYARKLLTRGVRVAVRTAYGRPSREIIRQVMHAGHDLVVKSARPEDDRRARWLGTTAIRLLRACPCPVWVVRPRPRPARRVLAAIDVLGAPAQRELGDEVLAFAAALVQGARAELHVVQTWEALGSGSSLLSTEDRAAMVELQRARVASELGAYLDRYRRWIDTPGHVHLPLGAQVRCIPDTARRTGADVVVMGTFGRRGLSSYLLGDTAEKLLPCLEASAFVVKPPGFAARLPHALPRQARAGEGLLAPQGNMLRIAGRAG